MMSLNHLCTLFLQLVDSITNKEYIIIIKKENEEDGDEDESEKHSR